MSQGIWDEWGETVSSIDGVNPGEPFFSVGDGLRRMYLESAYDTPEEFLASLECPAYPLSACRKDADRCRKTQK